MQRPDKLKKGDKIGIFMPASPVKEPYRSQGLDRLRELGYIPIEPRNCAPTRDFLARTPEESFQDLQNFIANPEIKALWAARGGYGSNHLLPLLSRLKIKEPKMIIGSSDISYLLWYILDHYGMLVFYGPMVFSSIAEGRFDAYNLKCTIEGNYSKLQIPGRILRPGKAKGVVTGGCLSNLTSLIGTPYLPVVEGRILLLEDVNERPYRLDRMFWQAYQSGLFSCIKALVLGVFPYCFKEARERESFLHRVSGYLKDFDIPIIYDLPIGHSDNIHTLPLGIEVEINTQRFSGLTFTEKCVR